MLKYVKINKKRVKRQIIEAMNSQIKNFNLISRWRKVKTFVAIYMHMLLVISFLEKVNYRGNF